MVDLFAAEVGEEGGDGRGWGRLFFHGFESCWGLERFWGRYRHAGGGSRQLCQ